MNAQALFNSTTIPVLEQVVDFAQSRHTVLAGNLANLDTPGYRVRDLSQEGFERQLGEAGRGRSRPDLCLSSVRTIVPMLTGYAGARTAVTCSEGMCRPSRLWC